ncbi:hypothetical protein EDC01DRAFT_758706 [Geopyxis carbonaria]|nr:hypothetical protein EDC01DRAFT_758706 [Geopyxis carbonaria]
MLALALLALLPAAHAWLPPPLTFPPNTPPAGVDVWCGKAYKATDAPFSSLVDAGWLHAPPKSDVPLVEFTCRPRVRPVIAGAGVGGGGSRADRAGRAEVVVGVRESEDVGVPWPAETEEKGKGKEGIYVVIEADGKQLGKAMVGVREEPWSVPIDLTALPPTGEYTLSCSLYLSPTADTPLTTATSSLLYLPPNPYNGSTVQLDLLTSQLHISGLPASSALPTRFFPIGYYTSWSNFLLPLNLTQLHQIRADGFTIIHPIPGGGGASEAWGPDSLRVFGEFLDACEEVGLWVQYDLRHTYSQPSELSTQVLAFRSHRALLTWYTADEPDGHNDATSAPATAYASITRLDGYHPIALTPNCGNYFFRQYTSGADILMPDVYPVAMNHSFSNVYHTECNVTYGCCGCDNCTPPPDELRGLGDRVGQMREYVRWTGGWKAFWGVGQGFGGGEFWEREPTGSEVGVMARDAVERGGVGGLLWWMAPAGEEVYEATREVAAWVKERGGYEDEGRGGKKGGEGAEVSGHSIGRVGGELI